MRKTKIIKGNNGISIGAYERVANIAVILKDAYMFVLGFNLRNGLWGIKSRLMISKVWDGGYYELRLPFGLYLVVRWDKADYNLIKHYV